MKNYKFGFTLIELIIVLAVIGILMAIGIPAYLSYVSESQAAVCISNRDTLRRQLAVQQALNQGKDLEEEFNRLSEEERAQYKCPANGVISVKENEVLCSVHSAGEMESILNDVKTSAEKVTWPYSDIKLINQYYQDHGGNLPKLDKSGDHGTWGKLFGDKNLYGAETALYWRPKRVMVNGKPEYILFASASNDASHASWAAYTCYYDGNYYVSGNISTGWKEGAIKTNGIAGLIDVGNGKVEDWFAANGWKKVG
ncbi:MAG: prepilin-type N-terminal cleavage/methylation domain-containing protein [Christensenella sp.]|nr:prepilin-type N-terminal cleavage/methylation domain-containing protein [Christensenella sp.]